jgi:type II secretory pathway component GspD/PulD (secretin)
MTRKISFVLFLAALFLMMGYIMPGLCAEHGGDAAFILPQYSKRISLDFKNADLKDVLKAFSKQIGANFILSDKVKATALTLFLENVPVEDALSKILVANGLTYEYDAASNIFMVYPFDPVIKEMIITRVYPLKNATVPSSKLFKTLNMDGAASTSSGSGILEPLQSVITKGGKIAEDARTNSLIITDVETNFPQIEELLAKLDVPISQVLIEVEMLDVLKSTTDLLGVKFGKEFFQVSGGSATSYFPFDSSNVVEKYAGKDTFSAGSMGAVNMSAVLEFLTTQTDTKNLARPRLLTLDNQTAQIKISTDEAVGVLSTATSTGGSTGSTVDQAERVKTGVFLTVTPQVNLLSGDITLAVSPKVIEATTGQQFGATTFKDPEERGANVILKVRAGETIILGGLLRKKNEKTITKFPLLGDIPFLGRLFRHDNTTGKDRELLIFITRILLMVMGWRSILRGLRSILSRERCP